MGSDLRGIIDESFQQSQSNSSGHKVIAAKLKGEFLRVCGTPEESLFFIAFTRCIDRLLTVNRKDQCAERVTSFLVEFVKQLLPANEVADEAYDQELEGPIQFLEKVVQRYADGFESRLAQVRLRSIILVLSILPFIPVNEDLFEELQEKALLRIKDSDIKVRVQAVLLVSRFDLTKKTSEVLIGAMREDPSAEVRIHALYNIAHGSKQLSEIAVERVRDPSVQIRNAMYNKVLKSIDFRTLSISARELIVRAGLTDRDPGVKKSAAALIAHKWVTLCDNNVELVLRRLDVVGRTEIADMVLVAFFDLRKDVIDMIVFDDNFFKNLWVEDCVLLRGFQNFCIKSGLTELQEERMPDLATIAATIERLWNKFEDPLTYANPTNDDDVEDLRANLPFMVDQLLQVAAKYDFYDETSRQYISEVTNKIAMSDEIPNDQLIAHIVDIQRKLNSSDTALVSWAFETIEATPSMATQRQESDVDILTGLMRALSLFAAVLTHVSSRDVVSYLPSLYTTYIVPALQSPIPEIMKTGLRCLGLACLLDYNFALRHISSFTDYVSNTSDKGPDVAEAVCLCIYAITDMLLTHAPDHNHDRTFSSDQHNDEDTSRYVEGNGNSGSESESDSDEEEDASSEKANESHVENLPYKKIMDLLVSVLNPTRTGREDLTIQSSAGLSLAKLILTKQIGDQDPTEILKNILVFYFACSAYPEEYSEVSYYENMPIEEKLGHIQQQILLFLKAYTLVGDGKLEMASVMLPACRMYSEWRKNYETAITVGEFIKQVVELTGSVFDSSSDEMIGNSHAVIAIGIIELILTVNDSATRRSLEATLIKLEISGASTQNLNTVKRMIESECNIDELSSSSTQKAITTFSNQIDELLAKKDDIANKSIIGEDSADDDDDDEHLDDIETAQEVEQSQPNEQSD